jgi:predicted nicotinamide N-methyase
MTQLRGDAPAAMVDAVVEELHLPGGPVFRARPRDFDAVREAQALSGPGRLTPYWATQWPSGRALAHFVARCSLSGKRVVELGCGLGLASVAAARAGASVVATDLAPEAVVYAAHNLALNGLQGDTAACDWRDVPTLGPFDLAIGADLLYRPDNKDWLLTALPAIAPEAWIADPGRGGCRDFLAAAASEWVIDTFPGTESVSVHRLRRRSGR